jgi:hypothetical protein
MLFTNNISGNKIFYSGINGPGEGVYWVIDGTEKVELFNKNVRQDAMVYWYGEDIVAIFAYGNISVRGIAYYDFKFKTVTFVDDPEYVDIERHLVVNTYDVYEGGREINIIDLGKSRVIKNINFFEDSDYEPTTAIGFNFELNDNEIIISYHFAFTGVKGVRIYNYSR